jgi:predicted nucleotidyltransferase
VIAKRVYHLLAELKYGLSELYGDRLRGVYLFGSYARGDQDHESDLDVLIILDDIPSYSLEIERTGALTSELSLSFNLSISRVFMSEWDWRKADSPLLRNARAEAVAA